MGISERGWTDRIENYCDGWTKRIIGTTSTAVLGQDYAQPAVVYAITVSFNTSVGSGDVVLVDGSATGDANDARRWTIHLASGANRAVETVPFPRGLVFETGLIVSATTVTGSVSLLYKPRYGA